MKYQVLFSLKSNEKKKKEFKTAVVNEPSVFEPLKFYCILLAYLKNSDSTAELFFSLSAIDFGTI